VHGAAHDIEGTGRANPLAAVSSAVLMLEHLGEVDAARASLAPCKNSRETLHFGYRGDHDTTNGESVNANHAHEKDLDGRSARRLGQGGDPRAHPHLALRHRAFEGIRAYKTDKGLAVFRLEEHTKRLLNSCKILMIDVPYSLEELVEATKETVRVNDVPEGCYIRPLVFLGYGEMGVNPLPSPVNVVIAVWPWGAYLGDDGAKNGVRMKISSWVRHAPTPCPLRQRPWADT